MRRMVICAALVLAAAAKTAVVAKTPTVDDMHAPINPWQSDELKNYHEVVQWESWVSEPSDGREGGSL